MTLKTYSITALVFAISCAIILFSFKSMPIAFGANATKGTPTCFASSSAISVGNQFAKVVAATNTIRAFMRIAQPLNATNTVFLHFCDVPATSANGYILSPAKTTNADYEFDMGLNTDFADTSAVRVITSTGSSTVLVTTCVY